MEYVYFEYSKGLTFVPYRTRYRLHIICLKSCVGFLLLLLVTVH